LRPSAAVALAGASWGRASGRIFRRFVLGIALMAAGGMLVGSCAILWALGDLPFDKPTNEPAKPTLLLEAANGEPLGRVGPLRAEDVCSAERRPGNCSSRCRRRTWSSVGRSLKIQRARVAAPRSHSVAAASPQTRSAGAGAQQLRRHFRSRSYPAFEGTPADTAGVLCNTRDEFIRETRRQRRTQPPCPPVLRRRPQAPITDPRGF
jgi:hypothetical protein